jgi:FSR family fosmidomycin resistance protein-like MFS transporter
MNFTDFISSRKLPAMEPQSDNSRTRRGALGAGSFAHFIHDGFTDCLFVLLPLWATGFGLSHAQVGFLKMCMSGSMSSMQVPAGFAAERFGERTVLVAGTLLVGSGFVLLAFADGFFTLAAALVLSGTGCAVQHPIASSIISNAYEGGRRRSALGIYNFAGDLGKVAMPFSVATIIGFYGWQAGASAYGAVGIASAVVILFVLTRLGLGARTAPAVPADNQPAAAQPAGWGIRDRRGFGVLASISMIDSATRMGFITFMPFLLISKGLDVAGIGFALALLFAGGAAGKLVCGLVAERLGILRTVVLTEVATSGLILAMITLPLTPAMAILPLMGIALNGTSSVLYGTVGDFVESRRQARAYGLFYTFGTASGALAPLGCGFLSDAFGLETALTVVAAVVALTLPLCVALRPALRAAEA